MKRCSLPFTAVTRNLLLSLSVMAAFLAAPAHGFQRNFPEKALRGVMQVGQPPWITMDGETAQLSPGARIKGVSNTLVMSATIAGQDLLVNYVLAPGGLVHEVWILTEDEAAQKRPRAADLKN